MASGRSTMCQEGLPCVRKVYHGVKKVYHGVRKAHHGVENITPVLVVETTRF